MKEEMTIKDWKLLATCFGIICLGLIAFMIANSSENNYSQENEILKTIIVSDIAYSEVRLIESEGDFYYDEAALAYELYDFENVEYNCRIARESYLEAAQGYREMKAEINDKEISTEKIIIIYVFMLENLVEMDNSLYEACEYLERAARAYKNNLYDLGDLEIEAMTEKVAEYDDAAEEYNNNLAEYEVELRKLL